MVEQLVQLLSLLVLVDRFRLGDEFVIAGVERRGETAEHAGDSKAVIREREVS